MKINTFLTTIAILTIGVSNYAAEASMSTQGLARISDIREVIALIQNLMETTPTASNEEIADFSGEEAVTKSLEDYSTKLGTFNTKIGTILQVNADALSLDSIFEGFSYEVPTTTTAIMNWLFLTLNSVYAFADTLYEYRDNEENAEIAINAQIGSKDITIVHPYTSNTFATDYADIGKLLGEIHNSGSTVFTKLAGINNQYVQAIIARTHYNMNLGIRETYALK